MRHILQCPACSKPFQVLAEQAGTRVQCPTCKQVVAIPDELPVAGEEVEPAPADEPADEKEPARPENTPSHAADKTGEHESGQAGNEDAQNGGPPTVLACSECEGKFGVTEDMFGTQVTCPHCSATVMVPEPTTTNAESTVGIGGSRTFAPAQGLDPGDVAEERGRYKARWRGDEANDPDLFAPGHDKRSGVETSAPASKEKSRKQEGNDASSRPKSRRKISSTSQLLDEPVSREPKPIDHLLPPKFEVIDPDALQIKVAATDHKVFLPDGQGGIQKFDDRIVRVRHEGEDVQLRNTSETEKARRRLLINMITIAILVVLLGLVFFLLQKYL